MSFPAHTLEYLKAAGARPDADINLGETALMLGLAFLPDTSPDRYRQHLKKMLEELKEESAQASADTLAARVKFLQDTLHEKNGYEGDERSYDNLDNANIARVIERRRGLPVALGILYITLGRGMGWKIDGLNFPGHFLIRLEKDGERIILDPFHGGKEMEAAELRQLLKSIAGEKAELSHRFYEPVSNRDILLRLQNNLKKRLIETEEYAQAALVVETMEMIAPEEYRTLFDKGILYARLGKNEKAAQALRLYIEKVPDAREKQQAKSILQQILVEP